MAAEIKGKFDVNARLVEGDPESFEVVADGKTVFSKAKEDRFPDAGEVSAAIRRNR